MKERPILFSAPMVRAILESRKTQTRRLVKPNPEISGYSCGGVPLYKFRDQRWFLHATPSRLGFAASHSPYRAGERLWVREACVVCDIGFDKSVAYRADGEPDSSWLRPIRWRPSIHMPRWACRITLEITDVRLQRLQDITAADAIAEGIKDQDAACFGPSGCFECNEKGCYGNRLDFRELWNSINSERAPWDRNPWVWAITFKVVKP